MNDRICVVCGQPESDHHEFVPVNKPDGCVCDPFEWRDPANIPPVCDRFSGYEDRQCKRCEHDFQCHHSE